MEMFTLPLGWILQSETHSTFCNQVISYHLTVSLFHAMPLHMSNLTLCVAFDGVQSSLSYDLWPVGRFDGLVAEFADHLTSVRDIPVVGFRILPSYVRIPFVINRLKHKDRFFNLWLRLQSQT